MDWNHDGKHDWHDHAFYNNVVEPGMKKSSSSAHKSSYYKNTDNSTNNIYDMHYSKRSKKEENKAAWSFIGLLVLSWLLLMGVGYLLGLLGELL